MKKLKIISLVILLTTVVNTLSYSQQKPVYSQYLFNALAINPAFAGSQDQISITALYRNQWVNFPGAPQIQTLSGNSALAKKRIGLGFVLTNDVIGIHRDVSLNLSYAYRIKMPNGNAFSMGLQGGFNAISSDFDRVDAFDVDDPNLTGFYNNFIPNFGFGTFYTGKDFYAGFSIPSIRNAKVLQEVVSESRQRRYYFLSAGKVFDLNHKLKIKPSTLIRIQERAPLGIDMNLQFIINQKVSVGNSYRSGDSNISNFEIQFNENFRIGYAYEWVLTKIDNYSRGSHEVMLNYRINIPGLSRVIYCPTFF